MLRRKKSKSKTVLEQMETAKANLISTPGSGLGELTDEQWSEIAACVRKGQKVQDALVMKLILRAVSTGAAVRPIYDACGINRTFKTMHE